MPRTAEAFVSRRECENFRRRLLDWFEREGRDLPWRRALDPYAVLVSELMLQQTQVASVLPYYRRWLERFPNFSALARASETQVLHVWEGLGYYARARNLHAAAREVMQHFGGEVPADLEKIRSLPGVGRYTAGAVASFAFDQAEPIVEANIARVLARLTKCEIPIDSAAGQAHLWSTARRLLPEGSARRHNSALIDLGATVCLPRKPRCSLCPVRDFCRVEEPEGLPRKRARPSMVRLTEPHQFARSSHRILLEKARERWRGMWILPRLARAPRRPPLLRLDFSFTHHRITLAVFDSQREITPNDDQQWFSQHALMRLPVPSPHRRALNHLLRPKPGSLEAIS
jgi:A/G-specific adenine glycosylase